MGKGEALRLSLYSLLALVCQFLSTQGNSQSLSKDKTNLMIFGMITMYFASINNSSK